MLGESISIQITLCNMALSWEFHVPTMESQGAVIKFCNYHMWAKL